MVEEGGRPVAFVQVSGETFEKRDLILGIRDGDWVEVRSGVAAGERVVTHGAFAIRLASVSSAIRCCRSPTSSSVCWKSLYSVPQSSYAARY